MNKKFMVVALMAALSTVGYGAWNENLQIDSLPLSQSADKGKTMENFNELKEQLQSNKNNLDTLNKFQEVTSEQVGNLTQEVESVKGDVDFVKGEVERVENDVTGLQNKVETGFENLQNQVSGNSQALGEMGQDIVALEKENNKQNDRLDKVEKENGKQNAAIEANKNQIEQNRQDIAKGDQINKVQNQQIGALQTENVEQNNRLDKVEKENDKQNGRLDKVEGKNKEQDKTIAQNKQDIADLRNDYTQVNGRLSGLEKKVDHLDDKMNKGLSLMAAMNAVDFQNVQTGEMAIGAGVGHYGNAQSVALGVAYSPVEDLTVNAKYSVTAGDADSFAVGAGATYKFKVGR